MATTERTRAWEWRTGCGAIAPSRDYEHRYFHAYDVNDNAACDVGIGLMATIEEPNEGSALCPTCVEYVKTHREGRSPR